MHRAKRFILVLIAAGISLFVEAQGNDSSSVLIKSARAQSSDKVTALKLKQSIRSKTLGNGICAVASSPDGKFVAIGSVITRQIVIWDIENNQEHLQINAGRGLIQNIITWSPDGRFVTDGRRWPPQNTWKLWDPTTGAVAKELSHPVRGPNGPVRFNGAGTRAAFRFIPANAALPDLAVFDTQTGEQRDYHSEISTQALHWLGDRLVLMGGWPTARDGQSLDGVVRKVGDRLVRVFDPVDKDRSVSSMVDWRPNLNPQLPDQGYDGVYESAIDADGKQVAFVFLGRDDRLRIEVFNLDPIGRRLAIPLEPRARPAAISYLSKGKQLAVLYEDRAGKIYNTLSGAVEASIPVAASLGGISVSRDESLIAVGAISEVLIYSTR